MAGFGSARRGRVDKSAGHAAALVRCLRRSLPVARDANAQCRALTAAFEAAVPPLIEPLAGGAQSRFLHDQLLSWGIKTGYLVENYARLVGRPSHPELTVLAGVFTRLYDDVLDEFDDSTAGVRLGELFSGGAFAPRSDVERLLEAVYRRLEELAPRTRNPTAHRALSGLHRRQLESLRQAGATLSGQEVWELSLAKGGLSTVVLGSLVHPPLSAAEEALLHELGAFLQLVDDYQDVADDRRYGLHTTATQGGVSLAYLLARLRDIGAGVSLAYGERRSRTFNDSLYLWLYTIGLARILRRGPAPRGHGRSVPRRFPMRVILRRRGVIR